MDAIVGAIIDALKTGGPEVIGILGWGFYILERYYITPKREKEFRDDLRSYQTAYSEMGDRVTETLHNFHTILEVLKDRGGN